MSSMAASLEAQRRVMGHTQRHRTRTSHPPSYMPPTRLNPTHVRIRSTLMGESRSTWAHVPEGLRGPHDGSTSADQSHPGALASAGIATIDAADRILPGMSAPGIAVCGEAVVYPCNECNLIWSKSRIKFRGHSQPGVVGIMANGKANGVNYHDVATTARRIWLAPPTLRGVFIFMQDAVDARRDIQTTCKHYYFFPKKKRKEKIQLYNNRDNPTQK